MWYSILDNDTYLQYTSICIQYTVIDVLYWNNSASLQYIVIKLQLYVALYQTESLQSSGILSMPPFSFSHKTVSIVKLQSVSCAELKFVTLLAGIPSALQTVVRQTIHMYQCQSNISIISSTGFINWIVLRSFFENHVFNNFFNEYHAINWLHSQKVK